MWRALIVFLLVSMPVYGLEPVEVSQIVNAIYWAEGGKSSFKPFGILSVSCSNFDDCKRVCRNTVVNNYRRWSMSTKELTYLEFLASRYAPLGSFNDPSNLNVNWLKNVQWYIDHPKEIK